MEILYIDENFIVCIKPAGVLSTDEPGGMPSLLREYLQDDKADIRSVHRLDRVVSGLMLYARNAPAASEFSRQIREGLFDKSYLAVCHGETEEKGRMADLMYRDKARKMSFVTDTPAKGVQEAILEYETLKRVEGMSLVRINLITGRTHQIRCQFASRRLPLVGERKYSTLGDECPIALWSNSISFYDMDGKRREYSAPPPSVYPWVKFVGLFCFKILNKI